MNKQAHWQSVYEAKAPTEMSWFRAHLDASLALIERVAPNRSARIIDAGGGESTLVDDLLARGYLDVTVIDIAPSAIEHCKKRLGSHSHSVRWLVGDVTRREFQRGWFDVWHDRAVFHFLTDPMERESYVRSVLKAVRPGGHVIVSTFGPKGPTKCSGLDVVRYDAESLHREFGKRFRIEESTVELHQTPWGSGQQFVYCCCRIDR